MTDRIAATLAVLEAAKEWHGLFGQPFEPTNKAWTKTTDALYGAIDALKSAESPDLDAKIAEVLPCTEHFYCGKDYTGKDMHNDDCYANLRPAVLDLIVSLLAIPLGGDGEPFDIRKTDGASYHWGHDRGVRRGFEQAREQAAKLCEEHLGNPIGAQAIRSLTPEGHK